MKYELIENATVVTPCGRTLFRIRALTTFGTVTAGALGGYIESEANLSQVSGDAWVYGDAQVSGDAWVSDNARVYGNAQVSGDAWVSDNARVYDNAQFGWHSRVGSENGTLTWALQKDRTVFVTRGCFSGSLDEFRAAVDETHGDNPHGRQYRLLIQFIELRAAEALKTYNPDGKD